MAPLTKERADGTRRFAREFFEANPGASAHACLKAMNNTRGVHVVPWIVTEVHKEHLARKLEPMLVHPAMPQTARGPRLVTPAEEEDFTPTPEDEMASNAKQEKQQTEQDALTSASRALLNAMREHGIEGCILTVTDAEGGPNAEWEVTYKKRSTGGVKL